MIFFILFGPISFWKIFVQDIRNVKDNYHNKGEGNNQGGEGDFFNFFCGIFCSSFLISIVHNEIGHKNIARKTVKNHLFLNSGIIMSKFENKLTAICSYMSILDIFEGFGGCHVAPFPSNDINSFIFLETDIK